MCSDFSKPELIIGVVAAVGTPIDRAVRLVEGALKNFDYVPQMLHLSKYTDYFRLDNPEIDRNTSPGDRLDAAMRLGTEVREKTGRDDILALAAIADIHRRRENSSNTAYVLRQLKHPAEIHQLRRTYDDRFLVLGFYMPLLGRKQHLLDLGISKEKVDELISRDNYEGTESGQRFRDTFHLSDAFVEMGKEDECQAELLRFLSLVFGKEVITPRKEEFGMFQAYGAALRSSQLGRQVGAAILSNLGDVIAVGTNEVPRAGGGSYWEGEDVDDRDHKRGFDSNDEMKRKMVEEIVREFSRAELLTLDLENEKIEQMAHKALANSRVDALIEFGRAVHAEADALASAARLGKSPIDADLFCTTFPCHLCAKQIVSSGIKTVTFIEPYPKSLAKELHDDAIALEEASKRKVLFKPFIGVAPHRYVQLFSSVDFTGKAITRKDPSGRVKENMFHLRLRMAEDDTRRKEEVVADDLRKLSEAGSLDDVSLLEPPGD